MHPIQFVQSQYAENPILVALVGAMITGSILWLLKAVPRFLLGLLVSAVTVSITVSSDDEVYDWLNDWLARHRYTRTARKLKITSRSVQSDWVLAPGFGRHLLWEEGTPILVDRQPVDKQGAANVFGRPREQFVLTSLGRSQERLRATIDKANRLRQKRDKMEVRLWQGGWWQPLARKAKRPLESVFLEDGMLEEILTEAKWFFGAGPWHQSLGIPYRLGWLFEGPPGTGKTTLAMAIACKFDRPVFILNLATVTDDNTLLAAFTTADPASILIIEDIDAVRITNERTESSGPTADPNASAPEPKEPKGITLSGLLNAIDGVASADGRLLVLTTNHPEKLDAALVRRNRVDRRWKFGPMSPGRAGEMALRFFPGREDVAAVVRGIAAERREMTASDWQSVLSRSRKDPAEIPRLVATL